VTLAEARNLEDCFAGFGRSAFRWEPLPSCGGGGAEAERIDAWRAGRPRPERSVRTSPWLARIAVTTTEGKRWMRVLVLDSPLTEYQAYRLAGLIESQAAGEQIRVMCRDAAPLVPDFWLFDDTVAVFLSYDAAGQFTGARLTRDPAEAALCVAERDRMVRRSVPLNEYLAERGQATRVA
jgi:Family of unknown function (DUF6879)